VTVLVLRGDARRLPLPDESVDLIVTSPPYFALRSYTDGGEHYGGQIGSESTPGEYIDNLIGCTREWMRVLKPTGSLWVNLGDKYNSAASGQNLNDLNERRPDLRARGTKRYDGGRGTTAAGIQPKSLCGLPWRYALRCVDDLGLILRAEVIWNKPNGLPEPVRDRVRRSHEQWFHMTREPRYFAAVDEIRTPLSEWSQKALNGKWVRHSNEVQDGTGSAGTIGAAGKPLAQSINPLGALPGSVWTVATQPLKVPAELGVDHFAAFPMELPRRIILGWSPSGICTACGEGRRPVSERGQRIHAWGDRAAWARDLSLGNTNGTDASTLGESWTRTITGEACACPDTTAPTRPAVVLDPFGGTGTTALVAKALGRVGITVDRSADYCRLAWWRTNDPGQLAAALEVERPPKQVDDQLDLFAEVVP
jgi:DNA modification methylase